MSKKIPLTQGKFTIVDDEDFEWLNQWKWQIDSDGYATRHALREERENGSGNKFRMARVIMRTPKGLQVDHINQDKLDNRKLNLRNCTATENQINKSWNIRNKSGYRNVYWNKMEKKWRVAFVRNHKEWHMGYFKNLEDAIQVSREINGF